MNILKQKKPQNIPVIHVILRAHGFKALYISVSKEYLCTVEELNHSPVFHITVAGTHVPLIYLYFSNNKVPPAILNVQN